MRLYPGIGALPVSGGIESEDVREQPVELDGGNESRTDVGGIILRAVEE